MGKKQALGRGFEGLIPTSLDVDSVAAPGEHIRQVDVSTIRANPDQPRKEFDENSIKELAQSIREHGIIQPIVLTPQTDKKTYRIVAGERRYRAAQSIGLQKLPAIVRDHKELEELEISLVENVQRVDLSPLEQAVSIVRLRDQFSMSVVDIAKKLGKAETTVSNIIRLLQLPKEAVTALQENRISEGHARAILALRGNESLQSELLNNIITQKLSVRAAEEYVKAKKAEQADATHKQVSSRLAKKVSAIKKHTGIKPEIKTRKRGGVVSLRYMNDKQLDMLLEQLTKS